mgnify:FL=1|jgi:hypothetical protein
MTHDDDFTSIEKGAMVGWRLAMGEQLTTRQLRDEFGITYQGAQYILETVSRRLPIIRTEDYRWGRFNHT